MDNLLVVLSFTESKADSKPLLQGWRRNTSDAPVICQWLVPDRKEELIKVSRRRLVAEFEMKDLDMMHYFLGMEVWQNADEISLVQGKYAVEILKRWWTAWPHLWHRTWSYWLLLHQSRLMPRCIIRWFVHWCTWRIQDPIFALLWTHWDIFTWWLQRV